MSALAAARLMLALALTAALGAAAMALVDVWVAAVLAALAVICGALGWLAVEAYRAMQEAHYRTRRTIGRWS